jgi:hypothetical protein
MAILFPNLDNIKHLKVQPEEGEIALLEFLYSNLDNTYEIYFQPYLGIDRPDIVIMRKNSGVMIIEVKDWNLTRYDLDENQNWVPKNHIIPPPLRSSPIKQVNTYKNNLFNLHIETLLEKSIKNKSYFSIINRAVYFHKATFEQINNFLTQYPQDRRDDFKYFDFFGFDNLRADNFKQTLGKRGLDRKSYLFNDELYKSFKRHLQPPMHTIEQGKTVVYPPEQKDLIESLPGNERKIKGVAGSGKTLVLAKRAVNAHLRHRDKVLILTGYNITLKNYIHDKISEVRENFDWQNFIMIHYHQFIISQANNHDISCYNADEPDLEMFEKVKDEIEKFKTILIDEIQDYQSSWVKLIKKYFLEEGGEFVVFGDEKQNIYSRIMDIDKSPWTGIAGRWKILKESYRLSPEIAAIAEMFQQYFFKNKYDIDKIISAQQDLFKSSLIKYFYLNSLDIGNIINIYQDILNKTQVHDNDVCFLATKIETLRFVDQRIRNQFPKETHHTMTMFETFEMFEFLEHKNKNELDKDIKNIRRNKKFNFWMNPGTTKLSTIHSFKGWEIPTLFLIIENESDDESRFTTDELVYTAITRSRQNLIIINIGNQKYDNFFKLAVK